MKSKALRRYYRITALILMGAVAVPFWSFVAMLYNFLMQYSLLPYNAVLVVPFMAVILAILVGFMFMPLLWNMPVRRQRIVLTTGATLVFLGLEWIAETVASRLDVLNVVMLYRRKMMPEEIAALARNTRFPLAIRIHYYIFSIILILAVLYLLYNLAHTLFGNGKTSKRLLVLQGSATACYTLAYLFVEVMRYENYAEKHITHASVLNAAVCFILAALVVGLSCGYFLYSSKYSKLIPPLLSALTVLIFYGAEYALLEGYFYLYNENIVVTLIIRALIVIFPSLLVCFLQRFTLKS